MPKSRPPYPTEFRQQIIELAGTCKTPTELSREFGPTTQTIINWLTQAACDVGKWQAGKNGLSTSEREELTRLRRECRQLKMERDILAKATAWFARKSDVGSPTSSNS